MAGKWKRIGPRVRMDYDRAEGCYKLSGHEGMTPEELAPYLKAAEEFLGPLEDEKPSKLRQQIDRSLDKSYAYYDKLNEEEKREAAANGMTWEEWRIEKKRRADEAEQQEAAALGIDVAALRRKKAALAGAKTRAETLAKRKKVREYERKRRARRKAEQGKREA